jgi:hypothetical protein
LWAGLSGDRSCKLHKRSLKTIAENALSSVSRLRPHAHPDVRHSLYFTAQC